MNAASGIYRITNTVNGKVYIGSSKDMAARCRNHRWALNAGTHGNSHLQAAWNKYGPESFEFGVFLECSDESLLSEEQGAISTCRSFDRNAGYNMKTAVRVEMREETKKKIGDIQRGKSKPPFSDEHCRNISKAARARSLSTFLRGIEHPRHGVKITEDQRKKLSIAHEGIWSRAKHPMLGKHQSADTKRKMSEAKKGKPWTEARRTAQIKRKEVLV